MRVLVVTAEFGDYAKGYVIKDQEEQDRVRESHPGHVVPAEHLGEAPEKDPTTEHDA